MQAGLQDFLIALAIVVVVSGIVLIICLIRFLFEQAELRKYNNLIKNHPTLDKFIRQYKNLNSAEINFHNRCIAPLMRREHDLRILLPTATKSEYEEYSKKIDKLITMIDAKKSYSASRFPYMDYYNKAVSYMQINFSDKEKKLAKKMGGWDI